MGDKFWYFITQTIYIPLTGQMMSVIFAFKDCSLLIGSLNCLGKDVFRWTSITGLK